MSGGFGQLVGLSVEQRGDGRAVGRFKAGDDHVNGHGTVHGGAIATLADSTMGMAVFAAADDDETPAPATIEMKVTFIEPAMPGELVAEALVRKRGKRITIVEAEITQDGDMVAHAIATFTSG